ncbi:Trp biosynthesis-associated membrane protein [Microbacterium sp. HD4P20]|uniref:Trp biosynthesis-associated membrane protein n=1 Tax=Microbacterium sp. HD4P20 TaxID=2864874 RepID=UPI001C63D3F6|nr:Trp biosynthesis-associated membrane protein [Microbacterium sp. HD4P20]MCP2636948.1 Trp biosynthesis-associated membrane protein [Microbacterium sp. HD4P20]
MIRSARLLAVVVIVACGAIGVISSTQTWLTAVLDDGVGHALEVPGASAIPVLAPLSLAVLALGAALSIVGLVLRYVFGVLSVLIGLTLAWLSAHVAFGHPVSAVASVVTESTGIAGESSVADLVASITATPWPGITLATSVVLVAAGAFTLAGARRWAATGRRYRTDESTHAATGGSRPHDAIDDWDDLSRGEDPTT